MLPASRIPLQNRSVNCTDDDCPQKDEDETDGDKFKLANHGPSCSRWDMDCAPSGGRPEARFGEAAVDALAVAPVKIRGIPGFRRASTDNLSQIRTRIIAHQGISSPR